MKLTTRELNGALIIGERDLKNLHGKNKAFMKNLIEALKSSIKVCLEKGIQEMELENTPVTRCIKELSEANEQYTKKNQFGKR